MLTTRINFLHFCHCVHARISSHTHHSLSRPANISLEISRRPLIELLSLWNYELLKNLWGGKCCLQLATLLLNELVCCIFRRHLPKNCNVCTRYHLCLNLCRCCFLCILCMPFHASYYLMSHWLWKSKFVPCIQPSLCVLYCHCTKHFPSELCFSNTYRGSSFSSFALLCWRFSYTVLPCYPCGRLGARCGRQTREFVD